MRQVANAGGLVGPQLKKVVAHEEMEVGRDQGRSGSKNEECNCPGSQAGKGSRVGMCRSSFVGHGPDSPLK